MTTGLPKAAVVKHSRYILASSSSTIVMGCNPNDILYDTLPLYHTVGGMIALGGTMKHGITGKSFSEALILASTNPQYHKRLFIELPVQHMKTTSAEHGQNMFLPCSVHVLHL